MSNPTTSYPTPVVGGFPDQGLTFPVDGTGLAFDAGYPLTFPSDQPGDLAGLFPTIMPEAERIIYDTVNDACNSRVIFPDDGQGLALPLAFSIPPDVSLFRGMDGSYAIPAGQNAGSAVPPIPVIRGWPAFPGKIPAIGVAEAQTVEDKSEQATQAGFAGDVYATDSLGNIVATCAYYAEPLLSTIIVELIHTNRDERDRLHDQLWRVIFPLRRILTVLSPQVRDVEIGSEKQDLPVDEQPTVMYVSLFTLEVHAEALIPSEIVASGVITELDTTVTPTEVPVSVPKDPIDLT